MIDTKFLDRSVWTSDNFCCTTTTTIGDILKLAVPVGWTIMALAASLAYLIQPLSQRDRPRWGSAGVVAVNALAGIGISLAIYTFNRKSVIFGREESIALTIHLVIACLFCLVSIGCVIFFGWYAPDMNKCAHKSCGADVGWSLLTFALSLFWLFSIGLGFRTRKQQEKEQTIQSSDPTGNLEIPM